MKIFFGLIGIVASVLLGLYFGLYVCFVGGGIDIITEIVKIFNGGTANALVMVVGVGKMAVAGFVGWITFYIVLIPSVIVLGWKPKKK